MYKNVCEKLFDLFVFNSEVYGIQDYVEEKVKYRTVRSPINKAILSSLLSSKEGVLIYQTKRDKIKWLCLDFDVSKEVIKENLEEKFEALKQEVAKFIKVLHESNIPYVLEFSGRRGVHVWIILEHEISKKKGRSVLDKIMTAYKLNSPVKVEGIEIDEFPKNSSYDQDLGLGVKLPLSVHKATNNVSILITSLEGEYNDYVKKDITAINLIEQEMILDNIILWKSNELEEFIEGYGGDNISENYIACEAYKIIDINENYIEKMSQCNAFSSLYEEFIQIGNLNERKRTLLAGLFARIKTNDNNQIGKEWLNTIFSESPSYNPQKTFEKIKKLHIWPATCSALEEATGVKCNYCSEKYIKSPIEYLQGSYDVVENKNSLRSFVKLKKLLTAECQYLFQNDEVRSILIYQQLKRVSLVELHDQINIPTLFKESIHYEEFFRRENSEKTRRLVSLYGKERLFSTALVFRIVEKFGCVFSPSSYAYRIDVSLGKNKIFGDWYKGWTKFQKGISDIINSPDYSNYRVIKLDIKSFYDSISHEHLRQLLLKIPDMENYVNRYGNLHSEELIEYKEIVAKLILILSVVQRGNVGVPQGPAFARVLAEMFLCDFDTLIENSLPAGSKYFRYVDDIFIFMESTEDVFNSILKKAEENISLKGLILNNEKSLNGMLSDHIEECRSYLNSPQYTINFISDNVNYLSIERIEQGKEELKTLLRGEGAIPFENSNINFFLSHFLFDSSLDDIRNSLVQYAFGNGFLRGSIYTKCFTHYFREYESFKEFRLSICESDGLRFEIFVNEFLNFLNFNPDRKDSLIGIFNYLKSTTIQRSFTKQTFLYLYFGHFQDEELEVDLSQLGDSVYDLILNTGGGEYFNAVYGKIKSSFSSMSDKKIVEVVYHLLVSRSDIDKIIFSDLLKIVISRISHDDNVQKGLPLTLLNSKKVDFKLVNKVYHLISLCTLIPEFSLDEMNPIWKSFVCYMNSLNDFSGVNQKWVVMLGEHDIHVDKVNSVITALAEHTFLPGVLDKHRIQNNFMVGVLVKLFELDHGALDSRLSDLLKSISQNADFPDFFSWMFLTDGDVRMFPDQKTGLILESKNNRLVLKKNDELMIRIPRNLLPDTGANVFSPHLIGEDSFTGETRLSFIFDISNVDSLRGDEYFSSYPDLWTFSTAFFSFLDSCKKRLDLLGANGHHFNLFIKNERVVPSQKLPLIELSYVDKYLFYDESPRFNNDSTYYNYCLKFIKEKTKSILNDSVENMYGGGLFENNFFPTGIHDGKSKVEYIKIFLRHFKKENLLFRIEYEIAKAKALYEFSFGPFSTAEQSTNEMISGKDLVEFVCRLLPQKTSLTEAKYIESMISSPVLNLSGNVDIKDMNLKQLFDVLMLKFDELYGEGNKLTSKIKAEHEQFKSLISSYFDDSVDIFTEFKIECLERETNSTISLNDNVVAAQNELSRDYDQVLFYQCFEDQDVSDLNYDVDLGDNKFFVCKVTDSFLIVAKIGFKIFSIFERCRERSLAMKRAHKIFDYDTLIYCPEEQENIKDVLEDENFTSCVKVVQYNNSHLSLEAAKKHLVSWLMPFSTEYRTVLLKLISSHYLPSELDHINYLQLLNSICFDNEFVFTHKSFNDYGGFYQVIKGAAPQIESQLRALVEAKEDMFENKKGITFMSDICITGTQILKAFDHYLFEETKESTEYWEFDSTIKQKLRELLEKGNISFYFLFYTKESKNSIRHYLKDKLKIDESKVRFQGKEVDLPSISFLDCENLGSKDKEKIVNLCKDDVELGQVYNTSSDSLKERVNGQINLVVRKNSLTKRGFIFFELENKYGRALFRRSEPKVEL